MNPEKHQARKTEATGHGLAHIRANPPKKVERPGYWAFAYRVFSSLEGFLGFRVWGVGLEALKVQGFRARSLESGVWGLSSGLRTLGIWASKVSGAAGFKPRNASFVAHWPIDPGSSEIMFASMK